jgi:hypothetical protein
MGILHKIASHLNDPVWAAVAQGDCVRTKLIAKVKLGEGGLDIRKESVQVLAKILGDYRAQIAMVAD